MAMLKGLLGGAAGAAVYTAYRDADTLFNSKDLATGVYDYWQKKGAANIAEVRRHMLAQLTYVVFLCIRSILYLCPTTYKNHFAAQVSRLQKNVEDLQHALLKSLHDRQQPTVIVAGSNGKSGWSTAGGVVLVVGGVALYLRFVKGWKLTDLMYVTRSSLSSLTENMKQGMEHMRAQLEAKAADLLERMAILGSKQEELLDAQGQLGDELAAVGGKVSLVSDQVGFSNHAILLLCGALSEMAKRVGISNGKYVTELEHLSRSVATTGLPHASAVGPGITLLPGVVSMIGT
eukprot:gene8362-8546_t